VKLTSIVHPKSEMGMAAANLLLDIIEGNKSLNQQEIMYAPELVVRESTRAL
jgi:GntR family transcriptional regulator of arabinose operon